MKLVKHSAIVVGVKANHKLQRFLKEERGEGGPVSGVAGIFIVVLLLLFLYGIFKQELDPFIKNMIFGKMNNLS